MLSHPVQRVNMSAELYNHLRQKVEYKRSLELYPMGDTILMICHLDDSMTVFTELEIRSFEIELEASEFDNSVAFILR